VKAPEEPRPQLENRNSKIDAAPRFDPEKSSGTARQKRLRHRESFWIPAESPNSRPGCPGKNDRDAKNTQGTHKERIPQNHPGRKKGAQKARKIRAASKDWTTRRSQSASSSPMTRTAPVAIQRPGAAGRRTRNSGFAHGAGTLPRLPTNSALPCKLNGTAAVSRTA